MADVCEQLYDGVAMTPERQVEHALAWIADDYPRKWLRRIGRSHIYTLAMLQGMDITLCEEFNMDHNLWAVLSRYLLMFRPSLAEVIFPKRSKVDDAGLDFEALWHRDVAANTFFRAPDWRAAKRQRGRAA